MNSTFYFVNSQKKIHSFLKNEIIEASKFYSRVVVISPISKKYLNDNFEFPSNVFFSFKTIFYPLFVIKGFFLSKSKISRADKQIAKKHKCWCLDYKKRRLKMLSNASFLESKLKKMHKKYGDGDIMSAWYDSGALAISLFSSKTKAKNIYSFCHSFEIDPLKNKYVNHFYCNYLNSTLKKIFFISKNKKNQFVQYSREHFYPIDDSKFSVRYLGIMHAIPHNVPACKTDGCLRIVSCSNVIPVKRIESIVETLSFTKRKIIWYCIGDGPSLIDVKAKAKSLLHDNVQVNFMGAMKNTDVINFYSKHCDKINCFINLSESEGIPVSIMEAMSFGIPCIATDVGGTNEIVNQNNGWLISSNFVPEKISEIVDSIDINDISYLSKRDESYKMISRVFCGPKNAEKFYSELIKCHEDC